MPKAATTNSTAVETTEQPTTEQSTAKKTVTTKPASNKAKSIAARNNERHLQETFDNAGQDRENYGGYAEAGPFYASKAPVANSVGAELGVATRNEKTGTVQRSGIGFYIRSDHFFGHTFEDVDVA